MARSLFPYFFPALPEVEEEFLELSPFTGRTSDVSISEDDQHIYVETPLPGVDPENIEVTFHQGSLCVKGSQEEKEEDKKRKYYRRARSTFSYCVHVPGEIDEGQEPQAEFDKGVMKVTFSKHKKSQPRRIEVRKK